MFFMHGVGVACYEVPAVGVRPDSVWHRRLVIRRT